MNAAGFPATKNAVNEFAICAQWFTMDKWNAQQQRQNWDGWECCAYQCTGSSDLWCHYVFILYYDPSFAVHGRGRWDILCENVNGYLCNSNIHLSSPFLFWFRLGDIWGHLFFYGFILPYFYLLLFSFYSVHIEKKNCRIARLEIGFPYALFYIY